MHESILTLAASLTGASADEAALLGALCTAEEQGWTARLPEGTTADSCGDAYLCACALCAAAGLLTARQGSGAASSFTAGSVSVSGCEAGAEAAAALRAQAERLMAAYARADDFAVRGVRV